jgi:hypothetical protein
MTVDKIMSSFMFQPMPIGQRLIGQMSLNLMVLPKRYGAKVECSMLSGIKTFD